ncbi:hypothetical protein A2W24_01245 [Microgenomates group bacterium RBG_16_45_19]|nr:MAG: hypothetical protein A2W24_01245 [Microgenomates group bacterium RBG_16_45_19]
MAVSQSKPSPQSAVDPHQWGVIMGVAVGLGTYALFGTKSGRVFSRWLKKTTRLIREDLDDYQATTHSPTYQELVQLVDELKRRPAKSLSSAPTWPPPSSLTRSFRALKDRFFASSPSVAATLEPVKPKERRFRTKAIPRSRAHSKKGS